MENLERPKDSKEFREQQAERMITFLDRIHAYEYTQELLSKIHVGDNEGEKFSFEDFRNFLIRINGIARDIPIKKRKPDGYGVLLSGFVGEVLVPKHEDKENLLEYAYSKIGYLKNSGDEAYMLPAVINAVHFFADGNGRTGRIFHVLLTEFNSPDDLKKALHSVVGLYGSETVDVNPHFVQVDLQKIVTLRHGIQFEGNGWEPLLPAGMTGAIANIEKPETPAAQEFMNLNKSDQLYCFISAYNFLKERNLISRVVYMPRNGEMLNQMPINL